MKKLLFLILLLIFYPSFSYAQYSSFETSQGTLLEGFSDPDDWTVGGTGGSVALDNTNFISNGASVAFTVTAGNTATMTKAISQTISSSSNILLWFYLDATTLANIPTSISDTVTISLKLSSTTNFSKYMTWNIRTKNIVLGWNRLVINASTMANTGAESWNNAMVRVQLSLTAGSGNVTVSFGELRFGYSGRTKVMLTFDNGYSTVQYTNAYVNKLKDLNYKGVIAIVPDYVGGTDDHAPFVGIECITLEQMTTLYNDGWDIVNHTKHHTNLDTITGEDLDTAVNDAYDYLITNGFTRSAHFFVYPAGKYTEEAIAKVQENHVMARVYRDEMPAQRFSHSYYSDSGNFKDIRYLQNGIAAGTYSTTADLTKAKAALDEALLQGGLVTYIFHDIQETPTTVGWSITDFNALIDYIKTKVDVDQADVITWTDYYNSFQTGITISGATMSGVTIN